MIQPPTSRVDLHCHSTASAEARLGVQRALGLPECATPPEEVYDLAKGRGMDFVTITDHDTIDGALAIADRPDVFVSEELTARFAGEPQAIHVLCYGITEEDHEWLQRHSGDVEACAEYLDGNAIASALAHPFFAVAAPLTPLHRRRLAELFPVWETRNGSRARELNLPAAIYIETHGGTGVGGSDDHAGVDIGRTWTETPFAGSPDELLEHLRAGRADACGDQGSAAKWAHSAMALGARTLGEGEAGRDGRRASPLAVLQIVERVVREGDARSSAVGADLDPAEARALLEAWLGAVGLEVRGRDLLAILQDDDFSHTELYRRARTAHERGLRRAVARTVATLERGEDVATVIPDMFDALVPAIPYAPAASFLGREKAKLVSREGDRRVAVVADAIGGVHGVSRTIEELRERGVPGFEIEVVGTDPSVDRRLAAVAEVDIPAYPGLRLGIPTLPGLVEALAEGRYDLLHVTSPGPAGLGAAMVARVSATPLVGSYHTELGAYTELRTGDETLAGAVDLAVAGLYRGCDTVLSPSASADDSLRRLGVAPGKIARWERGVELARFGSRHRVEGVFPGEINVLYAGRVTREKGVDLLADAFLAARRADPRLHLVLAGGGPEEGLLRARLGEGATFLGWLEGDDLARAYASADVFVFPSSTDTFGQVVLEAQASGLPVVAVDAGGPRDLVEDGVTGLLRPPRAEALGDAVCELATSPAVRARLGRAAERAVHGRTWERALGQLAAGYARVLAVPEGIARAA
jgi:glycosyltransferase involved in cell wall biosynthesis/predicted metal-dependent phosphoesterase TrpH